MRQKQGAAQSAEKTVRDIRRATLRRHSSEEKIRPVRRVLVFTIVAHALLMMSVNSTIVAAALDSLQHGLQTSINWAGWTLTAYSFGFVLMLPVNGKLSERYCRSRVFLGSIVAFIAALLRRGLASSVG